MKKNIIKVLVLIVFIFEIGIISLNHLKKDNLESLPIEKIQGSMVYDMSTQEKAIGAADNVFVGKINKIIKTTYDDNDIPSTIYEVEVLENIKGELPIDKSINLTQLGGLNKNQKSYTFYENAYFLDLESVYLILAFVPFQNGDLVIHNEYTYIKLENEPALLSTSSNNIINQYKEAYQNQIIPEDKIDNFKSRYEI